MTILEKQLAGQLKEGDNKAFDLLFNSYYQRMCLYAFDFVKSSDIAEEIVQDIFVKFWENRIQLNVEYSLKGYLFRSVYNASINYLRDNAKRNYIDIDTPGLELLMMKATDNELETLFEEQLEADLQLAIEQLPAQCREIFELCRFKGYTYPEIARQLQVSLSTVKTQMSRAMVTLSEKMDKYLKNI